MANLNDLERHDWASEYDQCLSPMHDGDWVKFEDVEEFLKTSHNSASRAIVLSQDDAESVLREFKELTYAWPSVLKRLFEKSQQHT